MKLIKKVDGNKAMLFFMENGDTRIVENPREIYAGYDGNGVKIIEIIDCSGKNIPFAQTLWKKWHLEQENNFFYFLK